MRVLLVSHNYLPAHAAGTEIYTAQLAAALRERGHEPFVFTTEKDVARPDFSLVEREHAGIPVLELTNNLLYTSFRRTWELPEAERAFVRVLDRVRPDLLHVQHLMHLSIGCVEEAARRGLPVLFTLHDYWLHCPRYGQRVMANGFVCRDLELERCARCMAGFQWAQGALERRLARVISGVRSATGLDLGAPARKARTLLRSRRSPREGEPDAAAIERMGGEMHARDAELRERVVRAVDLFLSPSRFLRERFVEWGIPPERIEHVPTGVDLALFAGGERAPRGAKLRIAFVGSLIPVKGAKLLLEAFARLDPELRARAELRIAGSARHAPDYQRELAELAPRAGAHLLGELAREDVSRLLRATDLLVVPSLWFENAPLVILEALAARTPLLVSNQGGMAELVEEGRSGFHFELGDARDLARQLARIVERPALLDALYARPVELPSFAAHAAAVEARYVRLVEARAARRG